MSSNALEEEFFAVEGRPADIAPAIRVLQMLRVEIDAAVERLRLSEPTTALAIIRNVHEQSGRLIGVVSAMTKVGTTER